MSANKDFLLAIDLSTPNGALVLEGNGYLYQRTLAAGSRVAGLFVEAEELLSEARLRPSDIGAVGVARGPGSFTGIRVAVMAAKTLSFALRIPLVAPGSLEVIAEACRGESGVVMAAIDAKRGEVYHGLFDLRGEGLTVLEPPAAGSPEEVISLMEDWQARGVEITLAGSGLAAFAGSRPAGRMDEPGRRGQALGRLCRRYLENWRVQDPMALMPLYIRKPDVGRPAGVQGGVPCA